MNYAHIYINFDMHSCAMTVCVQILHNQYFTPPVFCLTNAVEQHIINYICTFFSPQKRTEKRAFVLLIINFYEKTSTLCSSI